MKMQFNVKGMKQPDPFIFEDNGKFYLYVTARDGVEAYSADDLFGQWKFEGVICSVDGWLDYWAPSIIKHDGRYYLYYSCEKPGFCQRLHVSVADSPLGPYEHITVLYDRFSIDSHVVETSEGLFLFYTEDNHSDGRVGVSIYVDKLLDPATPAHLRKEIISPTFDEEIYQKNRNGDGRDWHTVEGPFWFREGDWQYVMYSGGCYQNDSYHIGYSAAKSDCEDLAAVDYIKDTDNGRFSPVLIKNDAEEGTGHHSVIKYKGQYYAIYHGRDVKATENDGYIEERTARICKLHVNDGKITAERM